MTTTNAPTTLDLPVAGMCCADEAAQVEAAIRSLPGVQEVHALVAAERATVRFDPDLVTSEQIATAITRAGYRVRGDPEADDSTPDRGPNVGQVIGWGVLAIVALVVVVAAIGERLGLFDAALDRLPWWIPAAAIVLGGWPVFRGVLQAALHRQITSHTLMTVGVIAAAAVGEWTTAALIVFFMRFAEWMEELTTERSRQAIRQLVKLAPMTARMERDGQEVEVPIESVTTGQVVLVRPGDRIPVDGEIVAGSAAVDEAAVTGESVPQDKAAGDRVFAATIAQAGFLKVRALRVGADTTFARIVRLVEEAEAQKAPVQRFADRFTAYYLPAVIGIAVLTLLVTGEVINAVAVVVVACACAIVIATPVVVLASVGAAAKRGLLIKGGLALEQLARVDTVVLDKTGTLTFGAPQVTDVIPRNGLGAPELLQAVATAERRSEHPLARAIVRAAHAQSLPLGEPAAFTSIAGRGITAQLADGQWLVGNRRLFNEHGVRLDAETEALSFRLETEGKTVFFAGRAGEVTGLVGVADTVRPDAVAALTELKRLGVRRLLLLTGDRDQVARAIADSLGLDYRAELLPEDKIAAIRQLQREGRVVLMVGDGVNDAPALAQADVGVAMGVAGTDVAIEAADVALMRDDWSMVPEAIRIGRRSARTIRQNLGFTAVYNVIGIGLAAVGLLPPVWAAAAQSLPDMAIMLNSARLLRVGRTAGERNA